MHELVGDKIKRLRKAIKISQKSLANNICDQSEISRLENNKYKPSYHVLKSIAERLGVDVKYLLEDDETRGDYIKDVLSELYKARRNRDYHTMKEIVEFEAKNPLFQTGVNQRILNWNKGIVLYELSNEKSKAIELMISCLSENDFDNLYTQLDVDILNAIGLIYRNEKEAKKAKFYLEKAYMIMKKVQDGSRVRDNLKTMYNLSKTYTDLGEFKNSLELCLKGIKVCKDNEDMFLYPELHYQIGRNYLYIQKGKLGIEYYQKAKYLFEFYGEAGKGAISKIIEEEIIAYETEGKII